MPKERQENYLLENVTIVHKNFQGKEGPYNSEGTRTFSVLIDQDTASDMQRKGWNVKTLKAREEGDDPQPFLPVVASYKYKPPLIIMIGSRNRTELSEDEIQILDWVDIRHVDLIVNASHWNVNGKGGIKAYVKTMYVTIEEDALQRKYADLDNLEDLPTPGGRVVD